MKFYYRVTVATVAACFFVLSFYAVGYTIWKYEGSSNDSLLWKMLRWTNEYTVHAGERVQPEANTDFKTIDILEEIHMKT